MASETEPTPSRAEIEQLAREMADLAEVAPAADAESRSESTPAPVRFDESAIVLRMRHGTYTGPGCPDVQERMLAKDKGFPYDGEHPAQCRWTGGSEGRPLTFQGGERIVLWPSVGGDAMHIATREAALASARALVKAGVAEWLTRPSDA